MLYVILLRYRAPLSEVDRHLAPHREFLLRHYAAGHFLLSGRLAPRTGGAILARADRRETVAGWLAEDPFQREGLADYEVIAWEPQLRAADVPPAWAPDAAVAG